MTTCYLAYANMVDANCKRWRENISRHETEQAAEDAALKYAQKYNRMPVKAEHTGVHKFYTLSKEEWRNEQYTGTSFSDPSVRTWMTNEGNGSVLLFEGLHFEIV